jgi:hypothetical protein
VRGTGAASRHRRAWGRRCLRAMAFLLPRERPSDELGIPRGRSCACGGWREHPDVEAGSVTRGPGCSCRVLSAPREVNLSGSFTSMPRAYPRRSGGHRGRGPALGHRARVGRRALPAARRPLVPRRRRLPGLGRLVLPRARAQHPHGRRRGVPVLSGPVGVSGGCAPLRRRRGRLGRHDPQGTPAGY